jgi:hypothetical protein
MPYDELVYWYGAHSSANLSSARYPDGSLSPHSTLYWEIPVDSTAYSAPFAQVSYIRQGPKRTAIRTDVTLAARYDRTAATFVPHGVTRIEVTKTALGGPPRPKSTVVTDPALVARVVAAFNHLTGAFAHTLPAACGSPTSGTYVYAATFYWPGHDLALDAGSPLCGVGMGLTLDDIKLRQTLEDDRILDAALESAL